MQKSLGGMDVFGMLVLVGLALLIVRGEMSKGKVAEYRPRSAIEKIRQARRGKS